MYKNTSDVHREIYIAFEGPNGKFSWQGNEEACDPAARPLEEEEESSEVTAG